MDEHGHCKDYLRYFSDYIDGELGSELCDQLQAHLVECTNCTIVLDTLRRTIELYHTSGQNEPLPEGVRARLFARLHLDDYK